MGVTITHAAEAFSLTYPTYFPEVPPSVKGARRIHLVLAAPNSVVFRLGRSYDKRNLPPVVVYQFENGSLPAYPSGVDTPVAGASRATIVRTA